jgi:hypothetical protein
MWKAKAQEYRTVNTPSCICFHQSLETYFVAMHAMLMEIYLGYLSIAIIGHIPGSFQK